eukprot:401018-Hanusia_phi.AAC.1
MTRLGPPLCRGDRDSACPECHLSSVTHGTVAVTTVRRSWRSRNRAVLARHVSAARLQPRRDRRRVRPDDRTAPGPSRDRRGRSDRTAAYRRRVTPGRAGRGRTVRRPVTGRLQLQCTVIGLGSQPGAARPGLSRRGRLGSS